MKKKYAIVGTGARALLFGKSFANELKDDAEIVGIYDINPKRAEVFSQDCGNAPIYHDFDDMLNKSGADVVLVTTIDSEHHHYIIRTLEAGIDVLSEKPMTINSESSREIIETEKRTGKKVMIAFNSRYMPYMIKVKKLLREGLIGDILSVDYNWYLDRDHGAEYFRRWHNQMKHSGGLLVHKSTHHFDLVNWFLEDEPEEVSAFGTLSYFGPNRNERGKRCLTCEFQNTCEQYFDITANDMIRKYYYKNEDEDGYIRDQCVFDEKIDIFDTMSVHVKYLQGTILNYSLIAYSPYKNFTLTFNGTKGRIEAEEIYNGVNEDGDTQFIKVFNHDGEEIVHRFKKPEGTHGGGDANMTRMLLTDESSDPLGQRAGTRAGAISLLTGVAANQSIKNKKIIKLQDLL